MGPRVTKGVRYEHAAIVYIPAGRTGNLGALLLLVEQFDATRFVIVTDCAETETTLRATFKRHSNVMLIRLDAKLGKGAALRAGLNLAEEEFVAFLSESELARAQDLRRAFILLENRLELDGVVGERFSSASHRRSLYAACAKALNMFGRVVFGIDVSDPQSSLKVFRRSSLVHVFEDLRLYNHGFDIELLFQAQRRHLRVIEMPIEPALPERVPLRFGLQALVALLFLRTLYSPLARVPFVAHLGRHYYVPVKRSYSILLFCWRDPRSPLAGGGEVYLHEQARCWIKAGHKVTWFAQSFPGASQTEQVDGINVVRWGRFPFVFLLAPLWYLFRSGRKFDFIVDCMNGIPFFTPLFSTKPKSCLIYHIHSHHFRDELPPVLANIAIWVETKLVPLVYRRCNFITISDSTKAEMEKLKISSLPIGLVHSGVSDGLIPGAKAERPTILYLGRLKRYKGVRRLIDAFARIKPDVPDARLVIAGTGDDLEPLKEYAADSGADGIEFTGQVTDADKIRLMQEAWVFGMPSSIEGWGIVVIEANSCSTPAVSFNVNGLRDCIRDGHTGFLVETDDEFYAKLHSLLTNSPARSQMARNALEWADNFSWEATAARTLQKIRDGQPWRAVFERSATAQRYNLRFRSVSEQNEVQLLPVSEYQSIP